MNLYDLLDKRVWAYLLKAPAEEISLWTAFWCRYNGHAAVVFYNPGGMEPDMHCSKCYDDLG